MADDDNKRPSAYGIVNKGATASKYGGGSGTSPGPWATGNGSSRWNGNYGAEEKKRRSMYDAGKGGSDD